MVMKYKVWIHVEEIDEDNDHYEECLDHTPFSIFVSESKDEALEFASNLETVYG